MKVALRVANTGRRDICEPTWTAGIAGLAGLGRRGPTVPITSAAPATIAAMIRPLPACSGTHPDPSISDRRRVYSSSSMSPRASRSSRMRRASELGRDEPDPGAGGIEPGGVPRWRTRVTMIQANAAQKTTKATITRTQSPSGSRRRIRSRGTSWRRPLKRRCSKSSVAHAVAPDRAEGLRFDHSRQAGPR